MAEYNKFPVQETLIVLCLLLSLPPTITSIHSSASNGSCIADERNALLSVKASLLDPNNSLSSWQGEDCCSWKGVRCSAKTGHVVKLNLRGMDPGKVGGKISYSLVKLRQQRYLDLSYNNFYGVQIPEFLGSMSSLRHLDLSYTGLLHGRIPPQVGNLTKLIYLDLKCWYRYNPLNYYPFSVNVAWLSQPSSLKHLDMSYLGPAFPSWLKSQTSIDLLHISNASITSIPDWFWVVFLRAKFLDLADNQISGTLPATLEFMAAENMVLSNNRLHGTVPKFPRNITRIDISKNSLSGTLPSDFGAPWLEDLMLYNNSISGTIPSSLCSLEYLLVLDLSTNMLTGEVPNCQEDMKYPIVVNLNTNNLPGEFPSVFKSCPNAIFIDLSYNLWELTSVDGEKMPFIALLRLRSNMFYGRIPSELAMSKELQFLDLACNNLSGSIPQSLDNLSAMARASGYSEILGRIADNSVVLGLYNSLYDFISFGEQVSVSTKGQQLEFSSQLSYTVLLDLSFNSLTGVIPQDIGALIGVKAFNLSWNRLSGKIPVNIGQLKQLESLDLSHNELSGKIPSSMTALTSLSSMNLSYNDLSGKIPTGNQFETFNASVYIGNVGLCGPPLTGSCPGNSSSQEIHGNHRDLEDISLYLAMIIGELAMSIELQFLDLAYNKLSGSIPQSIESVSVSTKEQQLEFSSQLSYMVVLDLSCNNLTGEIPRDVGALIALKAFNLSWNQLSGEIPVSIGQLNELESLDFSHNELSGEIPSSMSALTSLSSMNLSYNDLSGKIPTGNQFESFNAYVYIGNVGLCGPPLTGSCPGNSSSQDTHGNHRGLEDISLYFAMIIGFVFNLWVVFCVMLFKKRWRIAYFMCVDDLYDKTYVTVVVRCSILKRKFSTS
ncbi:putative leucine-rich repeat receptor-like protein kinase [Dichanthelium oligosanthes]|uniref:Putative leucine-rich repeat receptor-like protein kinase n=1 Tax=Dichanthelium oligosanthes TaxID=888268 RepID=A0A1E5UZV9_9POAL|nr:putative leucine-rich repeat receptor-like protein kinase [Dichanthelium oligosanthes]